MFQILNCEDVITLFLSCESRFLGNFVQIKQAMEKSGTEYKFIRKCILLALMLRSHDSVVSPTVTIIFCHYR